MDVESYEVSLRTLEDIYKNIEGDEMSCVQEVKGINEEAANNYVDEQEQYSVSQEQDSG